MDDKPKPGFSHSQMMRELRPDLEQLYDGPHAYSASELAKMHEEEFGYLPSRSTVAAWADKAVGEGKYVRVKVRRMNRNNIPFTCAAWVPKEIYDEWISQIGDGQDLG
jgi:hypothetical protein